MLIVLLDFSQILNADLCQMVSSCEGISASFFP